MSSDPKIRPRAPVTLDTSSTCWNEGKTQTNARTLANEVPVAIVFNGTTAAVMMASPCDIAEFALGFALTEGYISGLADIESFEEISTCAGIETRFWVTDMVQDAIAERKRTSLGPMGCGLCGIDSLQQALRPIASLDGGTALTAMFSADEITTATAALTAFQPLHNETRSVHAAGFIYPKQGVVLAKEDVGRHNALDKLSGSLALEKTPARDGAIIMTSRLSVDLVQKAATIKCPILIGVSAPSALAVDVAEKAGMTLIGFCRADRLDVFCGADRISMTS